LPNKKTPKPIRSAPAKDSGNPKLYDGAGQIVSSEQAGKAVSAFAQLWGTAEFDCGPQDYEFMVKQCVRDSELLSELEKRLPPRFANSEWNFKQLESNDLRLVSRAMRTVKTASFASVWRK
jgi:hypothetical protein